MKITDLSLSGRLPSTVIDLCGVRVLVDCPADLSPLLQHSPFPSFHGPPPPPLSLAVSSVLLDIFASSSPPSVLLASSPAGLLALPLVAAALGPKFPPVRVFATAPVVQTATAILSSLYSFNNSTLDLVSSSGSKEEVKSEDEDKKSAGDFMGDGKEEIAKNAETEKSTLDKSKSEVILLRIPGKDVISTVMGRVSCISYAEEVNISPEIIARSFPSGTEIGGCYWCLSRGYLSLSILDLIVLPPSTSASGPPAAASSGPSSYPHPCPFSPTGLAASSAVLLRCPPPLPLPPPSTTYPQTLDNAARTMVSVLASGGSVLVPCFPCGLFYDLLDRLASLVRSLRFPVSFFVLDPAANELLRLPSFAAEWLNSARADRVFVPEDPFCFTELLASGALRCYNSPVGNRDTPGSFGTDFRPPALIFASDPFCRTGSSAILFQNLVARSTTGAVVFTDPFACEHTNEILAPFQPLSCPVLSIPLAEYAAAEKEDMISTLEEAARSTGLPKKVIVTRSGIFPVPSSSSSSSSWDGGKKGIKEEDMVQDVEYYVVKEQPGTTAEIPKEVFDEDNTFVPGEIDERLTAAMKMKLLRDVVDRPLGTVVYVGKVPPCRAVIQMNGNYRLEPVDSNGNNDDDESDNKDVVKEQEPLLLGPIDLNELRNKIAEREGFRAVVLSQDDETIIKVFCGDETAIITTDSDSCSTDIITSSDSMATTLRSIILSL